MSELNQGSAENQSNGKNHGNFSDAQIAYFVGTTDFKTNLLNYFKSYKYGPQFSRAEIPNFTGFKEDADWVISQLEQLGYFKLSAAFKYDSMKRSPFDSDRQNPEKCFDEGKYTDDEIAYAIQLEAQHGNQTYLAVLSLWLYLS